MAEPPKERTENNPWPEWPKILKVDYGQEEFIDIYGRDPREYLTTVTKVNSDKDGNLESVETVNVEWKKDENGRFGSIPVKGSEKTWKSDMLLLAMGFVGSEEYLKDAFSVESDVRSNIKAEYGKFSTNMHKIFATGDARRGQSLVVTAINEGLAAAKAVNSFLRK